MSGPRLLADAPPPVRLGVFGAVVLGTFGCACGLVVGLVVYAPTAWAATFEVGLPSALVGAVGGALAGVVRSLSAPARRGGA